MKTNEIIQMNYIMSYDSSIWFNFVDGLSFSMSMWIRFNFVSTTALCDTEELMKCKR